MKLVSLIVIYCLITLEHVESRVQFSQFTFGGEKYSCTNNSCIDSFERVNGSLEWTYSFTGLKVAYEFLNNNESVILRESGRIHMFHDACGAGRICVRRLHDIDTVPRLSYREDLFREVDTIRVDTEQEYYTLFKTKLKVAIFLVHFVFMFVWLLIWLAKKVNTLVDWIIGQCKKECQVTEVCDCECCIRQRTYNVECECTCECGGDCLDEYKLLVQQEAKVNLYKALL